MAVSLRALERYALAKGDLEGHPSGPLWSLFPPQNMFLYRHPDLDNFLVAQIWREGSGKEGDSSDVPW